MIRSGDFEIRLTQTAIVRPGTSLSFNEHTIGGVTIRASITVVTDEEKQGTIKWSSKLEEGLVVTAYISSKHPSAALPEPIAFGNAENDEYFFDWCYQIV